MKNISIGVIVLFGAVFFCDMRACGVINVLIRIGLDKPVLKKDVPACDLWNYRKFGIDKPEQSDEYYCVQSAEYQKVFDTTGYFSETCNLVQKIPCALSSLKVKQEDYLFPKYVPKSFLEKIKTVQNQQSLLSHTMKVKFSNAQKKIETKKIIFNYTVEYDEKQNKIVAQELVAQDHSQESSMNKDYLVDVIELLLLIFHQ